MTLDMFWLAIGKEYPEIAASAVAVLLPFSTTYLCELSFSSLTFIKKNTHTHRERLSSVDQGLRVSLSKVPGYCVQ